MRETHTLCEFGPQVTRPNLPQLFQENQHLAFKGVNSNYSHYFKAFEFAAFEKAALEFSMTGKWRELWVFSHFSPALSHLLMTFQDAECRQDENYRWEAASPLEHLPQTQLADVLVHPSVSTSLCVSNLTTHGAAGENKSCSLPASWELPKDQLPRDLAPRPPSSHLSPAQHFHSCVPVSKANTASLSQPLRQLSALLLPFRGTLTCTQLDVLLLKWNLHHPHMSNYSHFPHSFSTLPRFLRGM